MVFGVPEYIFHALGQFQPVFAARSLHEPHPAERLYGAAQSFVRLEPHDHFALTVYVPGLVARYIRYGIGVHFQDSAIVAFFLQFGQKVFPQSFCPLARPAKERAVTVIRPYVLKYEIAHIPQRYSNSPVRKVFCFPVTYVYYIIICCFTVLSYFPGKKYRTFRVCKDTELM